MKAKVPEAIFKKAATSSADAPPMLDMDAVRKACELYRLCVRCAQAAELINKSKRPILYVGQGHSSLATSRLTRQVLVTAQRL